LQAGARKTLRTARDGRTHAPDAVGRTGKPPCRQGCCLPTSVPHAGRRSALRASSRRTG